MKEHNSQEEAKPVSPPRKPIPIKLISGLVLVVICLIVGFQNTSPVEIKFLFFTWIMPKIVLVLAIAVLGFGGGYFFSVYLGKKRRN